MKVIFMFFLTGLVVGCGTNTQQQSAENDTSDWKQEPMIDLRKAPEFDSLKVKAVHHSDLKKSRAAFRSIQERLKGTTVKEKQVTLYDTETKASYHWVEEELLKIELRLNKTNSISRKEYYLINKQPAPVFEMETDRVEMEQDPDYYESSEDSLFFNEAKLIHIACNLDCGAPYSSEYREEQEKRAKAELDAAE